MVCEQDPRVDNFYQARRAYELERRVLKQEKGKAKKALEPKQLQNIEKVLGNGGLKRPCEGKENEPPRKRRRSADRDLMAVLVS